MFLCHRFSRQILYLKQPNKKYLSGELNFILNILPVNFYVKLWGFEYCQFANLRKLTRNIVYAFQAKLNLSKLNWGLQIVVISK